jgi:hypothetical protein
MRTGSWWILTLAVLLALTAKVSDAGGDSATVTRTVVIAPSL